MKLILVPRRNVASVSLDTDKTTDRLWLSALATVPFALGAVVWWLFSSLGEQVHEKQMVQAWQSELAQQQLEVQAMQERVDDELSALMVRVAEQQARLLRLDALGEQVSIAAKLDNGEFDFSRRPALGGPVLQGDGLQVNRDSGAAVAGSTSPARDSLPVMLDNLAELIENREQQLALLGQQLMQRNTLNDVTVAGRPIRKGWLSSNYGYRTDPFHGEKAWHGGVDFAGKEGSDVIAVAGGVVTYSGKRYGYGQMVEINHGDGYSTRYAHNRENLVAVGDTVLKGQAIAVMGSSGRSTGPHVHFEVSRRGVPVDPGRYIYKASR